MKKWNSLLFGGLMTASLLAGSGMVSLASENSESAADKKLSVVATIFPEYDWVRQIVGESNENVELTLLLDSGVDLHSYQPTADDMIRISTCDIFIYVGGESDEWVEAALEGAMNKEMQVIELLDVLGDAVKEEEIVEGMEDDHDHDDEDHDEDDHDDEDHDEDDHDDEDHDEDDHDDEDHDDEDHDDEDHDHEDHEDDEHVWLSLKNAQVLVSYMADILAEADAANADLYAANAAAYNEELSALDAQYQAVVDDAAYDTILFGDRFPFRYLADDYGLSYYAAFAGCSAETEASFETITFLAQKMDELQLPAVLTLEGSDHKIAQTVVSSTKERNAEIIAMDSMQSTTSEDVSAGASYISIMEKNLEALQAALN